MMWRRLAATGALLAAVTAGQAATTVVDASGREVSLERPAQRIVALAPHIVENLFSAGAGNKLVGVVSYSDYPPQALAIPQVGSAYAWSLESVVALDPDLVVLWGSGNGLAALPQLERLGLTVYVSEPRQLADIANSIRDFGILAGTETSAQKSAEKLEREIRQLRSRYSHQASLQVFYQIWNQPLQTINGEHMISHVIALCGGRNIFTDEAQLAPRVSLETVLQADPDAIVASGMDESRPEWLDDWLPYRSLQAVNRGALLHIHPDIIQRPTARIAAGAAELCRKLDAVRTQSALDRETTGSVSPH
ncbi:cobalamin-binding protein [Seongchinamella sediminis]|uniref:Cobalamin-binding protein n=1 Tax=Seongchinamella sediminis TaxID=2283635 RepID=A0A3L7DYY3_9GAMM|nr:cobalamin-binding protein [Seongchinamella sediminis]RLQ22807.1 cobalamin-binding protein [Seongchinamella sediminis]